jgi:prepilin-type N-terminal cleavage/methylation domain-containing protein
MNHINRSTRGAFTLLELVAAVLVLSIISAVLMPVLSSASESYTTTRSIRTSTEQAAYALDRVARIIRQAPIGAGDAGVGILTATSTSLEFTDGTGFELNNGALEMLVSGTGNAKLCPNVDDLSIQYFADDGITSTLTAPTITHRICVTITSGDLRMSVVVHPRVWIGQGES